MLLKANFPMTNQHKWAAVVVAAAVFCFACNPARLIMKNDKGIDALKAKWIADWENDHPCPDLPAVNLDSLCALRSGNDFAFPTTAPDTVRDTVRRRDTLTTRETVIMPGRVVEQRILVPYVDTRALSLLNDSVVALRLRIAKLQGVTKEDNVSGQLSDAQAAKTKWLWAFIAACVVIAIGIAWKVYTFITNPVKSIL
jgi:hypothetical protein